MFLSETKQGFSFVQQFQHHFGYDHIHTVEPRGTSGGLALYYNNTYNVNIVFSSNRIIDVEATIEGKQVCLSFVYGDPVHNLREQVWERLTRFSLTRKVPWFIIGDLNEITGNHEKDGGPLRHASTFISFNNMIANCGLIEFPSIGNTMSWRGIRNRQTIRCRLDRALANDDWHNSYPFSFVEYLGMVGSDHRPIVATIESKVENKRTQFRFDKRWIGKEGLMDSIVKGWDAPQEGNWMNLVDKIRNCRHEISVWRKENLPFGKDKINDLQKALEEVQNDRSRTETEVKDVVQKLKEAYKEEELFWQ